MNNISASWLPSTASFPNTKSPVLKCDSPRIFGFSLSVIIINAVMAFAAFLMNGLIILTFVRISSVRALPSNVLILGLAISDSLVGAVAQPLYCVLLFVELKFGNAADISRTIGDIFHYTSYQLSSVSLFTLSAITADRFLAVHLHLRYQELVTSRRYGIALACMWMTSLLVFMRFLDTFRVFQILAAILLIIVIIINLYMIFKISRVIHRHSVQIQAQQQSVQQSIDMPRYKKSVNTMYFVIGAFLLCYIPHFGTVLLRGINDSMENPVCGLSSFLKYFASLVSTTLVFSNSVINPIIYCWRIQEMRQAMKTLVRRIWRREEDR